MPTPGDLQEFFQGILAVISHLPHHTKEVSRTFWGPGPPYL